MNLRIDVTEQDAAPDDDLDLTDEDLRGVKDSPRKRSLGLRRLGLGLMIPRSQAERSTWRRSGEALCGAHDCGLGSGSSVTMRDSEPSQPVGSEGRIVRSVRIKSCVASSGFAGHILRRPTTLPMGSSFGS